MTNTTYHEVSLILADFEAELANTGHFDSDAFDTLLTNFGLILDNVEAESQAANLKCMMQNVLVTAVNKKALSSGLYDIKYNRITTIYNDYKTAREKGSELCKCIASLCHRHSLAGAGNIFSEFSISTLTELLNLPCLIMTYLQSKELLRHSYNYLVTLHALYINADTKVNRSSINFTVRQVCKLNIAAGYLAESQIANCVNLVCSEEADISDRLAGEFGVNPSEQTSYFK